MSLLGCSVFAQVLERCRLQKRLSSGPAAPDSAVEHSAESDASQQAGEGPDEEDDKEHAASHSAGNQTPVKEQDLQAQVCARNTNCFMPKRIKPFHWQRLKKKASAK